MSLLLLSPNPSSNQFPIPLTPTSPQSYNSSKRRFCVLRPLIPELAFHMFARNINEYANELIERTIYLKKATSNQAPDFTNCVTAVRYLFGKAAQITIPENTWVGSLPRRLLEDPSKWCHVELRADELRTGDLLPVKKDVTRPCITSHIGVVIEVAGKKMIFHSSSEIRADDLHGRGRLESLDEFNKGYVQHEPFDVILTHRDDRENQTGQLNAGPASTTYVAEWRLSLTLVEVAALLQDAAETAV